MSWQDFIIFIGQIAFAAALFPSIFSSQKPAKATCAMTGGTLFAFTIAYASLDLLLAAVSVFICGVLWSVLLFQERTRRPFAWYDHFNDCVYRSEKDAELARQGGNVVRALYMEER